MDGISSINSVGAVASQFQPQFTAVAKAAAPAPAESAAVGTNALKLIQALLGTGAQDRVLDVKG